MAYNRGEKRGRHGHCFLSRKDTLAYPAYVNSLAIFMTLLIFQAKLEELQAEKQSVVSQKEAADDGNRKLVSADFFVCLIVNTYLPKWR